MATITIRASYDYSLEEKTPGRYEIFNRDGDNDIDGLYSKEEAIEEIRVEVISRFASTKIRLEEIE